MLENKQNTHKKNPSLQIQQKIKQYVYMKGEFTSKSRAFPDEHTRITNLQMSQHEKLFRIC